MGETRGVQHSIVADLTFLGKFDVAGEYIASQRKITLCPVDIRATSDVDCLVLTVRLCFSSPLDRRRVTDCCREAQVVRCPLQRP